MRQSFPFICLQSFGLSIKLSVPLLILEILGDKNSGGLWEFSAQGWILDGIPETREQAMMVQTLGITPRHVSE